MYCSIGHITDSISIEQNRGYPQRKGQIVDIWNSSGRQRPAVAKFDRNTSEDVVSRDVVDWFREPVSSIQKETRALGKPTTKHVDGQIYLGWTSEKTPGRYFQGTFYVATEKEPNYDIVLGTASTEALDASTKKFRFFR